MILPNAVREQAEEVVFNYDDSRHTMQGMLDELWTLFSEAAVEQERQNRAERLAQQFHEVYERLAPEFGYSTREISRKPWADVLEQNRKLMTAVCREIGDKR